MAPWKKGRTLAGALMALLLLAAAAEAEEIVLDQGWALRSGQGIKQGGAELSRPGYDDRDWRQASAPATVLAVLVKNGVLPDPYFGMNLARIPGAWPPPFDISTMPMPPFSPFRHQWWYRTEFELGSFLPQGQVWLTFQGINYSAEIWLNEKKLAGPDTVAGTYRCFRFNVTDLVKRGENALAVGVYAPRHRDLAFTWVDWNPVPPDRNMGLWRPVHIETTGPVDLRYPHVVSHLDLPSLETARLTVTVDAVNGSDRPVAGEVRGRIGSIKFSKRIELGPGQAREVVFTPDDHPGLAVEDPELWWPYELGPQNLHRLVIEFVSGGGVSDRETVKFGIREITSEFTPAGDRVFLVNGRRLLIKGAGWAPDMMLRYMPERLENEIAYVKHMNLNTIRLEGKLESDYFYQLCDREGIMVMPGWCCCHHWERWRNWDREDYIVSEESQRDQIKRLRAHPSMLAWLNGSDNPPPPRVEKRYLAMLEQCRWPNPSISSATEKPSPLSGPSGVKMNGPYDWVPPVYWYQDPGKYGGAWGFNTETSPGPAVPPIESLAAMLPQSHAWPIDKHWRFHAGRNMFYSLRIYNEALEKRYGPAITAEQYAMKSQAAAYEGQRAMFEAFRKNKYDSTGVIQWMLNDAWPSLIWHLYDYYLRPAGGYFGTRTACQPLHVLYAYGDQAVYVVNSYHKSFQGLIVRARAFDLEMREIHSKSTALDVPPDGSVRAFTLPQPEAAAGIWFLKLELTDEKGKLIDDNFYWLSKKRDEPDWRRSQWHYTPVKQYADFTALDLLPNVLLHVTDPAFDKNGDRGVLRFTVENHSSSLAFLIRVKAVDGARGEILPVLYSDNYFSLLPGESKKVEARLKLDCMEAAAPSIELCGWNAETVHAWVEKTPSFP